MAKEQFFGLNALIVEFMLMLDVIRGDKQAFLSYWDYLAGSALPLLDQG